MCFPLFSSTILSPQPANQLRSAEWATAALPTIQTTAVWVLKLSTLTIELHADYGTERTHNESWVKGRQNVGKTLRLGQTKSVLLTGHNLCHLFWAFICFYLFSFSFFWKLTKRTWVKLVGLWWYHIVTFSAVLDNYATINTFKRKVYRPMRAELEVSLRCDVILQMAAAGQSNQRRFTMFFLSLRLSNLCRGCLDADRRSRRERLLLLQLTDVIVAEWRDVNIAQPCSYEPFSLQYGANLYLLLAPTTRLSPYFLLNTSHLHPSPRWTIGHRYTKRMRAADKGKVRCYAACTPLRWPPALHTTSTSWLDGVNSRQNPQIGFLNHLLAGVITASKWYALSQVRKEAAHHPHALNVQFIYIKKNDAPHVNVVPRRHKLK